MAMVEKSEKSLSLQIPPHGQHWAFNFEDSFNAQTICLVWQIFYTILIQPFFELKTSHIKKISVSIIYYSK